MSLIPSKKMLVVFRHEFLNRIKSKSYLIFTFAGPLLMLLLVTAPALLVSLDSGGMRTIAIVDETGKFRSHFEGEGPVQRDARRLDALSDRSDAPTMVASGEDIRFTVVPTETTIDTLRAMIARDSIAGYLQLTGELLSDSAREGAILRLKNANDFSLISYVERRYATAVREERMRARGLDPGFLVNLESISDLKTIKVSGNTESRDSGGSFFAAYLTGLFMYVGLLLYGTMIIRSVIEEKSTRVIEIIASSVRPYDLLVGKVLGNGAASLIQMTIWGSMFALLATAGVTAMQAISKSDLGIHIDPLLFIYFVVYFALGFLIYATLFAAAGATADQETDVQQTAFPITMIVVVPILLLTSVIKSPSTPLNIILSMVPFFSPILMMGRIFSETPPFWQIALSLVLMILTFFGVLSVAAKIYRVGILMYGKRFTPKEIWRWLRYS